MFFRLNYNNPENRLFEKKGTDKFMWELNKLNEFLLLIYTAKNHAQIKNILVFMSTDNYWPEMRNATQNERGIFHVHSKLK